MLILCYIFGSLRIFLYVDGEFIFHIFFTERIDRINELSRPKPVPEGFLDDRFVTFLNFNTNFFILRNLKTSSRNSSANVLV